MKAAFRTLFVFRLSGASHAVPVSFLRLGAVTADLSDAGISLLLSRIEIGPHCIRGIPEPNRTAALKIHQTLEALAAVVDDQGNIDWEGFDPDNGVLPLASAVAPQVSQGSAIQHQPATKHGKAM